MDEIDERVSRHYGWSGLMETIEEEIRRNGIDPTRVTVDELAPVDNYHWHRLAGTLALARVAAITADDSVLDVGGGIGGPARQLAHRYGCRVTVLDLTAEYCAVGERLTAWTHLADQVSFVCGNALAMPFPDGSFDVVWTQHASMNIADKAGLYRGDGSGRPSRRAVGVLRRTRRAQPANSLPGPMGVRPVLQFPPAA